MKTSIECFPCLVRQIVYTVRQFFNTPQEQEETARYLLNMISEEDLRQPPPMIVSDLHREIRNRLDDPDPFAEIKHNSNAMALEWYGELKALISKSPDPFLTAVRVAIAGNIIDYGLKGNVESEQVQRCVEQALSADIDQQSIEEFHTKAESAETILYLADNAGEIVFDRLLIEQLSPERATVAVKGKPVLNDATIEDARQIGLTEIVRVVDTGTDILGTHIDSCPNEVRELIESADLVISKGQANYELLSDVSREITFLFLLKCPLVAKRLNRPEGSYIVYNKDRD